MSCLCDKCAALCCRYFALPLDNPETAKDYDDIRWYMLHENVVVFIEEGQWYIGILNKCKHLQDDNRCGIYDTRPQVCRKYSTENCEYHGGDYNFEKLFTSADALHAYAQEQLKEARDQKRRKRLGKSRRRAGVLKLKPQALIPAADVKPPVLTVRRNGSGNGKAVSLPVV